MRLFVLVTLLIVNYALLSVLGDSSNEITNKLLQTNDIAHAHGWSENSNVNANANANSYSGLSPVILMPGDGGSRLQAKLDRTDVLHHYCERKSSDWFDLWVNLSLLVPFALDCWVDK